MISYFCERVVFCIAFFKAHIELITTVHSPMYLICVNVLTKTQRRGDRVRKKYLLVFELIASFNHKYTWFAGDSPTKSWTMHLCECWICSALKPTIVFPFTPEFGSICVRANAVAVSHIFGPFSLLSLHQYILENYANTDVNIHCKLLLSMHP